MAPDHTQRHPPPHTHTHTHTHFVTLSWTRDRAVADTSPWQQTPFTTDRLPCPQRDSNPQSEQARPQTYTLDHAAVGSAELNVIVNTERTRVRTECSLFYCKLPYRI